MKGQVFAGKSRFNPSQVQFTQVLKNLSEGELLRFQSLTGSIHTSAKTGVQIPPAPVSIPHRFNSHFAGLGIISIRGSPFQSLTGSIHSFLRTSVLSSKRGFNPSQVQFTPVQAVNENGIKVKFQSLTGSIHTKKSRGLIKR